MVEQQKAPDEGASCFCRKLTIASQPLKVLLEPNDDLTVVARARRVFLSELSDVIAAPCYSRLMRLKVAATKSEGRQQRRRESVEQRLFFALVSAHRSRYPELAWVHSIPNGAWVSYKQAQTLLAEGVRSGVADVFAPIARGGYHGMYIEFKAPLERVTGKQRTYPSKKQREFLGYVASEGYLAVIADDAQLAFDLLMRYLRGEVVRGERSDIVQVRK